jgi:nucleotide-binding universal stress UspA family protein
MKLLLAVDGSYNSDLALDSVLAADWPADSSIHLVSVAEPVNKHLDLVALGIGKMAESAQKSLEADLQELLNETVVKLKEKFGDGKATSALLQGNPVEQILKTAKDKDSTLIIVGSHGTGAAAGADFGKVALALASKAPCSVKIVSDLSVETLEKSAGKPGVAMRYLVAINESENSKAVLNLFSTRPYPAESSIQVLSVVPEMKRAERSRFFKATAIAETEEKVQTAQKLSADKLVKEATDKLQESFPKAKVTGHVLIGSPRSLILQVAQDWPADVIIMGATDHKEGMFGSMTGSTASAVVVYATCSVLVVRPKG